MMSIKEYLVEYPLAEAYDGSVNACWVSSPRSLAEAPLDVPVSSGDADDASYLAVLDD